MASVGGLVLATSLLLLPIARAQAVDTDAKPSLQQLFNQASTALESDDCATALPIFEKLAVDPRVKPGSLPAAAIALRRGHCLFKTGRSDEGEQYIELGLPIVRAAGQDFTQDVTDADKNLAILAISRWDHDGAVRYLKDQLALSEGEARLDPLVMLSTVMAFDGGQAPLDYLAEAERIATASKTEKKTALGTIHTMRGRILMNRGENKAALSELKRALSLYGGLTPRVTLSQASMRGDLAQAELLNGDKDEARLYLAYTGAGRIEESPFAMASAMAPPQCGPETGLKPEDSAIVEFSIGENGDVTAAQTVYTRGDYAAAAAFARAVSRWYWQPENLAKVPLFYRVLTRVELRCSNSDNNLPSIVTPLIDRFSAWANPHLRGIDVGSGKMGYSLDALQRVARDREAEGATAAMVAALGMRDILHPHPGKVEAEQMDKAMAAAIADKLPPEVVSTLYTFRKMATDRDRQFGRRMGRPRLPDIPADLAAAGEAALRGDALAQDALLLSSNRPELTSNKPSEPVLEGVAADTRLPEHHPLRQVALIELANLAVQRHDLDQAQSYFQRTGLTEEQCALIGVTPSIRKQGGSSADFPVDALRMGFEGWVKLEFDIEADGKTAHIRPTIAYPPFVFVDAASNVAAEVRYAASYRPSNGPACTAHQHAVKFVIPH